MKNDPFEGWVELTEKDVMNDLEIAKEMLDLMIERNTIVNEDLILDKHN